MTADPYISVIVTAYNRKKYLLGAVQSVLNQTLSKDLYEVIVVKNFRDEAIDRRLEEWGVFNLHSEDARYGHMIVEALRFARGDVVAVLDDDDEFMPGKLQTVLRAFSSHPELGFYRNNLLIVNDSGRPIGRSGVREAVEADCSEWGPLRYMAAHDLLFNNSSIAIRREILEGDVATLERVELVLDSYCPLRALMDGYRAFMDPRPLTAYRVHGDNTTLKLGSFESFRLHGARTSLRHLKDAKLILKAAEGSRCERLARYLYALHVIGFMVAARGLGIERELRGSLGLSLRDITEYFGVELSSLNPLKLASVALRVVSLALPEALGSYVAYLVYMWNLKRSGGGRTKVH
ncbi:MAG: glycosyltransferase [Nitrososphaeria archaeon]